MVVQLFGVNLIKRKHEGTQVEVGTTKNSPDSPFQNPNPLGTLAAVFAKAECVCHGVTYPLGPNQTATILIGDPDIGISAQWNLELALDR